MRRYVLCNFSAVAAPARSGKGVNTANRMADSQSSSGGVSGWMKDNWKALAKGAAAVGTAGLAAAYGDHIGDWIGGMVPQEQTAMITEPIMRLDNLHDGTTTLEYQTVPAASAMNVGMNGFNAGGSWGLKNMVSPDATAVTDLTYDKHGVQVLPEQLTRPNAVSLGNDQLKDVLGRGNKLLGLQFRSQYAPYKLAQMPADMGNGYWTHAAKTVGRQLALPGSDVPYSTAPHTTGIFR